MGVTQSDRESSSTEHVYLTDVMKIANILIARISSYGNMDDESASTGVIPAPPTPQEVVLRDFIFATSGGTTIHRSVGPAIFTCSSKTRSNHP